MDNKKTMRDILDRIYYMCAYAPNFPKDTLSTLDDMFKKLIDELQNCITHSKKQNVRAWLEAAQAEAEEAYNCYSEGDTKKGRALLESAAFHVDEAISGRTAKARFAVDPTGEVGEFSNKKGN